MREVPPPRWPRRLLGDEVFREVFEPAWHEVRAERVQRSRSRAVVPMTLVLFLQCLWIRINRSAPRRRRGDGLMLSLWRELRLGFRMLRVRPGFSAVAIITLAVAIGANASIFSVLNGVLLRPLPFGEGTELVTLDIVGPRGFPVSLSLPNLRDWKEGSETLNLMGATASWSMVRRTADGAVVADVQITAGAFFEALGVPALIGRTYTAAESARGGEPLAVLTYGYWQREYAGDAGVIGRTVNLDGIEVPIVGVMPAGFAYPSAETEIFAPMGPMSNLPWEDRQSSFGGRAIARLAPGATLSEAQAEMDRLTRRIEEDDGRPGARVEVRTLAGHLRGDTGREYLVLMGAVVLVLLIAGVNVANLLLARGESRSRETAVRMALGASRGAIVRQVVVESIVLAAIGAILGFGIAIAGVAGVHRWLQLPPILEQQVAVDPTALLFTAALALCVGVVFGMIPALRLGREARGSVVREGGRGTASRAGRRARSTLVVLELAMAAVLLVGSGLMVRSLVALRRTEIGYESGGVLTARVAPPSEDGTGREAWIAFYETLEQRLTADPGVQSAASMLLVPLAHRSWELLLQPEGEVFRADEGASVLYNIVSPSWFEMMRVPVIRGRTFDGRDRNETEPVAIVDQTLAERFWPGQDPIGRRITFEWFVDEAGDTVPTYRTIVGVVPNVRHYDMREPSRIQAYVPLGQSLRTWGSSLFVAARTTGDPPAFARRLRSIVAEVDRNAPLYQVAPLDEYVWENMAGDTALGGLLSIFGAIAVGLAAIGVFGVMSLIVGERTREIGVRLAIGARPGQVLTMVLGRTLAVAGIGLVIGLLAAAALSRLLGAFLYGLSPLSPMVYAGAAALLLGIAVAAGLLPALRATRIDPMLTLRAEN